ncbi:MAG: redox-sensitive transcriptional activator SoxR [Pseudomonadota bacterium]
MVGGLSVGEVARRTGVAVSALHFYERKGLIKTERSSSNHRVYPRSVIRRVTVIQVAQKAGLTLAEILEAFSHLPQDKAISTQDWGSVSRAWRDNLEQRIALLTTLRDNLTDCMGCGCLSVAQCPLVNENDKHEGDGPGAALI